MPIHGTGAKTSEYAVLPMPALNLQTRIIALFVLLMVLVQLGGFVLINTVGMAAARKTAGDELVAGARVFDRLLEQDTQRLAQGARLMSADYAFREAIATGDADTITSVLANHGRRIDADVMMLIGLDQRVIADTLDATPGAAFPFPALLAKAEAAQQSAAIVLLRGRLYELVLVPVLAPLPIAWVALGFSVNDALAQDLHRLTGQQVSFLSRQGNEPWRLQASTLLEVDRETLLGDVAADRFAGSDDAGNSVYIDGAVTRILPLPARVGASVTAVLQQPLSSALEPFRRLQRQLALISVLAVAISILASLMIARGIVRPVRELAQVARRIAAGNYSTVPASPRADEIGALANAFRTMQEGLVVRESRIMDLAYRDTLTALPNRALYSERLDQAIEAATRMDSPLAVLLMDVDHFKDVNDSLGHPIGDMLLCEVSARVQSVVRRSTETVARLGGDEFAILLPEATAADAQNIAAEITHALEAPMTLSGHLVDVRASIGIAVFPTHGRESATLLRRADVAMYAAKRKNQGVAVWDDRFDQHSSDRLLLMTDLRKAVDNDELTLVYQPKVPLGNTSENYVEALVRWRHPTRGIVPPLEFIPFAEQTGYIRAITQWVLAHAVTQCALWRAEGLAMNVSINLSARDIMDPELPDRFALMLQQNFCAARWFTLEITESAILDDPAHAIENLKRLNALGCRLAIDDYGTGYSSLSYLRHLPVHELKIDKTFVIGMASDRSDEVIVQSTIDLAHKMGLAVVAEGVEDEATFDRLRTLGCDMVQGYWLSRPLGAAELSAWMRGSAWTRSLPVETRGLLRVV
ncbi:MAG TPA: EAL domain-containing protein [Casimicrobiaceae bacterium]|nr:EAL domain-containing protein [Casimicrobiaceae bacterium]